jgi:phosphoglycolate phosphatase
MKYDSIIFDVDGTLWYSCDKIAKIWAKEVEKYTGEPCHWDANTMEPQFGKTMDDIMENLLPSLTKAQQHEVGQLCFATENQELAKDPGVLYEGVEETLRELAKKYPLFIVSNCQQGYIEVLLDAYHLRDCFQGWLCWGDTNLEKNDTIRVLMERHGLNCPVYVGDTQGDANACQKAGIDMIFAAYGLGKVKNPKQTIYHPTDLLTYFG